MKTIYILSLTALICGTTPAQLVITRSAPMPNTLDRLALAAAPPAPVFYVPDPYRVFNGETQHLDASWFPVAGKVVQVHPGEGLRIQGSIAGVPQAQDFFVVHLPVAAADHDMLPPAGCVLMVHDAGTYTYATAAGSSRTIHKYDYGIPWTPPPPTPEQVEARYAQKKQEIADGKEKALAYNEALAAKGDAYGLLRMAERYRDGNGVEKNFSTARIYFMRASDAGSPDAAKELAQMLAQPASPEK